MRSTLESIETIAAPNTEGISADGDAAIHMMQAVSEKELEAKERKVLTPFYYSMTSYQWIIACAVYIFTNSDRCTDHPHCYLYHNRLSLKQRKP